MIGKPKYLLQIKWKKLQATESDNLGLSSTNKVSFYWDRLKIQIFLKFFMYLQITYIISVELYDPIANFGEEYTKLKDPQKKYNLGCL